MGVRYLEKEKDCIDYLLLQTAMFDSKEESYMNLEIKKMKWQLEYLCEMA